MHKKWDKSNGFYTINELIHHYVSEKMELVHLELILDNLFMATTKEEEWWVKKKSADAQYAEQKALVEYLENLWHETRKELEKNQAERAS